MSPDIALLGAKGLTLPLTISLCRLETLGKCPACDLWGIPLGKLYAVKFSQGGPDVYLSHGSQISLAVHMTFVAFSVLQNNMQLTLFLLS